MVSVRSAGSVVESAGPRSGPHLLWIEPQRHQDTKESRSTLVSLCLGGLSRLQIDGCKSEFEPRRQGELRIADWGLRIEQRSDDGHGDASLRFSVISIRSVGSVVESTGPRSGPYSVVDILWRPWCLGGSKRLRIDDCRLGIEPRRRGGYGEENPQMPTDRHRSEHHKGTDDCGWTSADCGSNSADGRGRFSAGSAVESSGPRSGPCSRVSAGGLPL